MKNQINKPTVNITLFGMNLKVIRGGKSPRLSVSEPIFPNVRRIHSHFTYEVFFITDGRLNIVTDEEQRKYERSVVIIPPHIGHYTVPDGNECFCLLFSVESNSKNPELCKRLQSRLESGIVSFDISEDVVFYINTLSNKSDICSVASEKDVELLASLIFNEIVSMLLAIEHAPYQINAESKHIGAIETYINSNFQRKITLLDISSQVYLSNKQVARIIRKEYDCTLSELVNNKKLDAAKMMLKNTDLKIGEIALQVNLGSENYFYTIFKKKYGITPLQYRKKNKTNLSNPITE